MQRAEVLETKQLGGNVRAGSAPTPFVGETTSPEVPVSLLDDTSST